MGISCRYWCNQPRQRKPKKRLNILLLLIKTSLAQQMQYRGQSGLDRTRSI
jgi:hypothetical protein